MKTKTLFTIILLIYSVISASQIINIPADYPSIQQGINAATDDEIVLVQPGIYPENIDFQGKNIIVASLFFTTQDTTYISQTIIDGKQIDKVVTFNSGESQDAILSGFTITNGHSSSSGGGISCVYGSNPQLDNLYITGNSAQYNGGGIICGGSASPSLVNVRIKNNSAGLDGGGIYCYNNSSPSLENVTISGNSSAYHGGGICCLQYSSPHLNSVTLSHNSTIDGGGIYCAINSNLNLLDVTLDNNSATNGGGIFMTEASPTLSGLIISNNTANRGGGIYCDERSELHLSQSTISNNLATNKGAGIHAFNARLYLDDCTITENEISGGQGGAIYFNCDGEVIDLPEVMINNTVFSNNIGTDNGSSVGASSGAIFLKPTDYPPFDIHIENCTFENNTSKSNTALRITGYELGFKIINCSFLSNEAELYTAGVSLTGGCAGEIINCLFASNIANTAGEEWNSGGASLWNGVEASFINCTFVDNSAFFGSALTTFDSEVLMLNCIVYDNNDDQITLLDGEETGSLLTVGYSNFQNGENGIDVGELSELIWGDGNIDEDPIFVNSGSHPYQINDYSPCIDHGTLDTTALNIPEIDLACEARIFNERIDMGAYEWSTFVGENEFEVQGAKLKVQSFPNPFTTSTTIAYDLHYASTVQITIYNHLGKRIEAIQQTQSAGKQQIVWDAKGLPSGVYYGVLKTESKTQTMKMIKMKQK